MYCDVIVPHTRLGELTYRFEGPAGDAPVPGDCVRVRLRGRRVKAVVVGRPDRSPVARVIPVEEVVERGAVPPGVLALAQWTADYYRVPLGEGFGAALPRGICGYRPRTGTSSRPTAGVVTPSGDAREFADGEFEWGRFCVRCSGRGTAQLELVRGFVGRALERGGVVCLLPEAVLDGWVAALTAEFGGTVAAYHGRLTVSERKKAWRRIRDGVQRVVVGTRAAAFAPVATLGGIAVVGEHDPVFKEERYPRYHARDVAVKRGQAARCPVLLSDPTPSVETWYNITTGRYRWLDRPSPGERRRSAFVVDMRRHRGGLFSPLLVRELNRALEAGAAVLYVNRKGVSRHVVCRDCGYLLQCDSCGVPMVLDAGGTLHCGLCGASRKAPENCPGCGGTEYRFGAPGIDMVRRELGKLECVHRVATVTRELREPVDCRPGSVVVGTRAVLTRAWPAGVRLAAAVHFDYDLVVPDFRARERAFQTLSELERRCRACDARLVVQTWRPDDAAVECALEQSPGRFMDGELAARRELGFPPYRRLVAVEFRGRDAGEVRSRAADMVRRLSGQPGVDVLGPVEAPGGAAAGLRVLVKVPRGRRVEGLPVDDAGRRVDVRVDVDPLAVA